jgi:16S rRNA (guanine527-N7)-methyltransferase
VSLASELTRLGVASTPAQLAALEAYVDELLRWNARINLTAARNRDDALQHVVDSCALVREVPSNISVLVDVGSGGGLPAAMIAILRPGVQVTALEPVRKKLAFLQTLARTVPNLRPLPDRADDHARRDYDVATSRATFALDEWLRIGASFVRPGGVVLGMEGVDQVALPPGAERRSYELADRTRAIIVYAP